MDAFATLDRSRVEFRRVLAGVTHEHWELATPCEEWDVRELVNHVLGGNVRYTLLLHGAAADEMAATRSMDHIGDDALASYDTSAAEVIAAETSPNLNFGSANVPKRNKLEGLERCYRVEQTPS